MSWFKKKTETQSEKSHIPLIDQPLQMPEKTNEELLTELRRIEKMRSRIGFFVVFFPILIRPDNRPLEEKSVVDIATSYLPAPSLKPNEISENQSQN